jgi:hypothetical protein
MSTVGSTSRKKKYKSLMTEVKKMGRPDGGWWLTVARGEANDVGNQESLTWLGKKSVVKIATNPEKDAAVMSVLTLRLYYIIIYFKPTDYSIGM